MQFIAGRTQTLFRPLAKEPYFVFVLCPVAPTILIEKLTELLSATAQKQGCIEALRP